MKKIYCIEEWIPENDGLPVNYLDLTDKYYLSSLELPVRCGWPEVREYDDEEKFKNDLMNSMEHFCIISKVFIKEVPDDYRPVTHLQAAE